MLDDSTRIRPRAAALAVTGLLTTTGSHAAEAGPSDPCPWVNSTASAEVRAAQILAQMTTDEKLSVTHGAQFPGYDGVVAPIARLCIPALNLHDSGAGVVMGATTAMPAPIAVGQVCFPYPHPAVGSG
ncbi:MAG: beta-glucosidase [Mycobacterium sp.]|jgi:beta-glucosidase|nr:beta-glucosidase [Mycobacterium sp.]